MRYLLWGVRFELWRCRYYFNTVSYLALKKLTQHHISVARNGLHFVETVRILNRNFYRRNAPTAPYVRKFENKVQEIGILFDNTWYPRVRLVRLIENIACITDSVRMTPKISTCRRSQEVNINCTSPKRILHKDLNL